MRLLSYAYKGRSSFGIVRGDGVIDLHGKLPGNCASLKGLLAGGYLANADALAKTAKPDILLAEIEFQPVIPDPDKIICVGMNYREHAAEVGRDVTQQPSLFARFAASQVGHNCPLIKPIVSDQFDYEGELAVIIGQKGRHVSREDAFQHVAGYSCYNEGSVRDWQRHTTQFLAGKTFKGTGGFGPWLVTTDEIPDASRLTLRTRLNGVTMQEASVAQMIFSIPELIAYCSTIIDLEPGDVIVTGTPAGVGSKRNPPVFMKAGDVAEVEIDGIGCLRNPVEAEKPIAGSKRAN